MIESEKNLELRRKFHDYLEKTMEEVKNHPEYDFNKNNYHLNSEDGKLALIVLDYTTTLRDLIVDLRRVEVFIRRFSNKSFYNENDIDELDYIKYHNEVFIHKIHTILEIKKLAINKFYKIGLKEKDCSWKNLKNQPKLKDNPIMKVLEFYFNSFEHIIEHRNLNTHRAQFFDKKNEELKLDNLIYSSSEKSGIDVGDEFKKIMPKPVLNYLIKDYKKEKIAYIKNANNVAEKYVEYFETFILMDFFRITK